MKKVFVVVAILMTGLVAIGCGNKKEDKSKQDTSVASSENSESDKVPERMKVKYTAIVKADRAEGDTHLWVEALTPTEENGEVPPSLSGEVILLVTDENIISYEDQTTETIKAGQKIEVWLPELPMTTMSLPPQVAGKDVLAIHVLKAE